MYAGRLAPSPTGLLHLGHARTFWTAFERARSVGGTLWLRDEDLDPQRARTEFSIAMKEDLRWLGIAWDSEVRQSDRLPLYRSALEQLLAHDLAYPCTCSRRDLAQSIAQSIAAPHDEDDEPIYNGHCRPQPNRFSSVRHPDPEQRERDGSASPQLPHKFSAHTNYRFRVPGNEPVTFTDLCAGPQSFTPGIDFGDFLIWRKALQQHPGDAGLPSYQLACVVDDAAMNITEVVRGRDLLKSTARQILLQRALALPTPDYFHCDLMRDEHGVRLAKRHDALSLRALREQGLTPAEVRALF